MDTIFDVTWKTKDNLNARKDLYILYDHPEISVPINSMVSRKPKAKYTLAKDGKVKICNWVKSLRFPDSYASNLGRCIDMNECQLKDMKELWLSRVHVEAHSRCIQTNIARFRMAYINWSEFILSNHMLCTAWFGVALKIREKCGHNVVQLGKSFSPAFSGSM